jgi:methionine-S-sulfoxide reductase
MNSETIILGGGCFWCMEGVFQLVKGVEKVVSGYAGGQVLNPTYQQVCSVETGHAEVVQITYNPNIIKLEEILDIFFHLHDPTTLNKQGADVGTQYRSVVYYEDENQLPVIEKVMEESQKDWYDRIVTQVEKLDIFYPAEDYHQNYFKNNPDQGYCQLVINPKIAKLKQKYLVKLVD